MPPLMGTLLYLFLFMTTNKIFCMMGAYTR